MEALGRLFNVVPTADAVEVSVKDCSGVTFVCVGADTYTVAEASDAAGTGAAGLPIARWYTNTGAVGVTDWVLATDEDPETTPGIIAVAANAVIHVDAKSLSDGFDYVRCSSASAGLVIAILHDLNIQRDAAELVAPAL